MRKICAHALRVTGLTFTLVLGGCLGTTLSTLDDMTAGQGSRIAMFQTTVEKFHKGISWGAPETVAKYVDPAMAGNFHRKFPGYSDKEKLVSIDIDDVAYEDDAKIAYADITVKYFKKSNYVVDTKQQSERWEYRAMGGGWILVEPDSKVTAASKSAENEKEAERKAEAAAQESTRG